MHSITDCSKAAYSDLKGVRRRPVARDAKCDRYHAVLTITQTKLNVFKCGIACCSNSVSMKLSSVSESS